MVLQTVSVEHSVRDFPFSLSYLFSLLSYERYTVASSTQLSFFTGTTQKHTPTLLLRVKQNAVTCQSLSRKR